MAGGQGNEKHQYNNSTRGITTKCLITVVPFTKDIVILLSIAYTLSLEHTQDDKNIIILQGSGTHDRLVLGCMTPFLLT